jgi:hypothetical protein
MLDISVLTLSETREDNPRFRLDAEFFGKDAQAAYKALRSHRRFGDLVAHGYRVIYENTQIIPREEGIVDGLPFFLQAADIETPFIRAEGMGCVRKSDWDRYPKGRIVPGEVLIEVKGLAEKVALVQDDIPLNTLVTGTCYKMQAHDPLDARLLIAFLGSRYGQALKDRLKSNLLVAFISKDDLFGMPVPDFGLRLKRKLAKAIDDTFVHNRRSSEKLKRAEAVLTSALGLAGWNPLEPLTYTRKASEVFAAKRTDAEYYHPAKEGFMKRLRSLPGQSLDAHYESIRDMFDPTGSHVGEYVRNFDLTDAMQPVLDDEKPVMPALEVGSSKKRLAAGDVVISRLRAYLREIALVRTTSTVPSVGSSEFIVLRPRNGKKPTLSRSALLVFLRSHPVQTVLKWSRDGSHHPRFGDEDLMCLPVPDVVCAVAPTIERLFEEVLTARADARAVLSQARRAVEIAIEDSEAAALKYLRVS